MGHGLGGATQVPQVRRPRLSAEACSSAHASLTALALPCSWTKERRVLLVMSKAKRKWVSVRPLPSIRNFPQQYDVSAGGEGWQWDLRWVPRGPGRACPLMGQ